MGEITSSRWDIVRRRLAQWAMPSSDWERIQTYEERLYDAALQLQRAGSQIRQLTQDTGRYKIGWNNLAVGEYNPETISLDEYKKMTNYDAQVIAGFEIIQMGVLMKPWRIIHPDQEIALTLEKALQRMKRPTLRDSMKEQLKAILYGYSVTEIVFDDYKGWWMPRQLNGLKTFDPVKIKFFPDDFGNLLKCELEVMGLQIALPLDRTLIWTHDKEWGNWYGKSILRGCYKNWFIKDAMLKFANIAYEHFGSPLFLGISSTLKDMTTISEAIQHLFARSQAVIRKADANDPTDIKIIESKRSEMPFDRYIRYHEEMILRRMLISERLFEGGGGVYGPKVPFDLLLMRFEDYRINLVEQINELLQITTDLNWSVDVYPRFEFAPLTSLDQQAIVNKIFEAIDKRIIFRTEPWIREQLGFPVLPDDFKLPDEEEEEDEDAKKLSRFPTLPGRYLVKPHAQWLVSGQKKIIVASRPYKMYAHREIYLVSEDGIHGIIREDDPDGPYDKEIQAKLENQHRISEREWELWWPAEEEFWIWKPWVKKRFDPPLPYKPPRGVQTYIRAVKPRSD